MELAPTQEAVVLPHFFTLHSLPIGTYLIITIISAPSRTWVHLRVVDIRDEMREHRLQWFGRVMMWAEKNLVRVIQRLKS